MIKAKAQISLLFALFLSVLSLSAATITWMGGDGNWEDPSMWDSGTIPTTTDEVILANGSIELHNATSVRALLVQSSATFILGASAQLTVLPTAATGVPVQVIGKVNVLGRLRVLNQLGFTDYKYVILSGGTWQTEAGGEVLLDGGGLRLESSNSSFNNRGYLWMEKTSNSFFRLLHVGGIFINGRTGQVDITTNYNNGVLGSPIYISPNGQFVNHGAFEAQSDGNEEFINDNRLDNWGHLILDGLNLRNDDGANLTNRHWGQIRIQHLASTGFNFINSTGARVYNYGLMDIRNSTAASAVLNNGRFDNYSAGNVRLYGEYTYQQLRITDSGEWHNYGRLSCGNSTSDDRNAIWNDGDFYNRTNGSVNIQGTHQESGFRNTSYFLNEGYLSTNDLFDNEDIVENATCGEISARAGINSTSVWLNDGWLRYSGTTPFNNSGYFQHTGLIEDPNNIIDPNEIVNDGVMAQTLTQAVFVGENQNFLVLGEWWQVSTDGVIYNEPEGDVIGEYNPGTNVFTAYPDTEGMQEVFFMAEAVNGNCENWFSVAIDGGIQEAGRAFSANPNVPTSAYGIGVYPNPTKGRAELKLPTMLPDELHHWALYHSGGQLMQEGQTYAGAPVALDLSTMPVGIYLLRVSNPQGEWVYSERLVKQ